jgi:hypothetical protein
MFAFPVARSQCQYICHKISNKPNASSPKQHCTYHPGNNEVHDEFNYVLEVAHYVLHQNATELTHESAGPCTQVRHIHKYVDSFLFPRWLSTLGRPIVPFFPPACVAASAATVIAPPRSTRHCSAQTFRTTAGTPESYISFPSSK